MPKLVVYPQPEPIATMNITPLIDVMLVLLVMLIITIPVASHKVSVDLPRPAPVDEIVRPHHLSIARDGAMAWDGRVIVDAALPGLIVAAQAEHPDPTLILDADPEAHYERFDQAIVAVKRAGIHRLGFSGLQPMAE